MDSILDTIEKNGGNRSAVHLFDVDGPELLPYATLVTSRNTGASDFQAVIGAYELARSSPADFSRWFSIV